ncbi:hypothetical protein EHZ77_22190, partial [Aeromonas dhakensis]
MDPGQRGRETKTGPVRRRRVLRAQPMRIYRPYIEAEALAKWLPPQGFACQVEQLEARVGGHFQMAFT